MGEYTEQKNKIIKILRDVPEKERADLLANAVMSLKVEEFWAFVDKAMKRYERMPNWWKRRQGSIDVYLASLRDACNEKEEKPELTEKEKAAIERCPLGGCD